MHCEDTHSELDCRINYATVSQLPAGPESRLEVGLNVDDVATFTANMMTTLSRRLLFLVLLFVFLTLSWAWFWSAFRLDDSCQLQGSGPDRKPFLKFSDADKLLSNEKFTLIITSHLPRKNLLKETLQLYSKSSLISKIIVVWPLNETPLPDDLAVYFSMDSHPPVILRSYANDSVMNRFLPYNDVDTACILSMDDDLRVSDAALREGFETWKAHPMQMVGLSPRALTCTHDEQLQYIWQRPILWMTGYHFVLTNFAFFHISLMRQVWQMPPQTIQWVREHNNCEDILFAYAAANATHLPGIVLKVPLLNKGKGFLFFFLGCTSHISFIVFLQVMPQASAKHLNTQIFDMNAHRCLWKH